MQCIYCLKNHNEGITFKKTEHVLSQSFGTFENNFTLKSVVCDDCNKYLGDSLELNLARGTLEGAFRYEYGVKYPKEYKSLGKKDPIIIKVAEGPFKGSYAYKIYSEVDDNVVIIPAPQVGFLNKETSEYDFYLIEDIPEIKELRKKGYDLDDPKGLFIPLKHMEVIREVLKEKKIPFKMSEEFDYPLKKGQQWQCDVEGTIDDIVLRGVAKIAFNYLAYWQESDFVLQKDFDIIRGFILNGMKPDYPITRVVEDPILGDEPVVGKRRMGHLITLNWATDGKSIIAQVSLFNWMTYRICLAREFSGEHRDIKKGNFFDFNSKKILEIDTEKPKENE